MHCIFWQMYVCAFCCVRSPCECLGTVPQSEHLVFEREHLLLCFVHFVVRALSQCEHISVLGALPREKLRFMIFLRDSYQKTSSEVLLCLFFV